MSIPISFKGIFKKRTKLEPMQRGFMAEVLIVKPGYTDEFGEKKGKDDYFTLKQFADNQSELDFNGYVGKKVEVKGYLSGREFTTSDGMGYANNLLLKEVSIIENKGS